MTCCGRSRRGAPAAPASSSCILGAPAACCSSSRRRRMGQTERGEPVIRAGGLVIVHLITPTEKFWGVLQDLGVAGVTLRGINLSSFDDWMGQAARRGDQTLGLSTMFVPLFRVERDLGLAEEGGDEELGGLPS